MFFLGMDLLPPLAGIKARVLIVKVFYIMRFMHMIAIMRIIFDRYFILDLS